MARWTERFDGQLDVRPPVGDREASALPARRGVALIVAEGDQPVLLLPAADLRSRVVGRLRAPDAQERSRMPDLHHVARKILWKLTDSHFQTDLEFLELARLVWPEAYCDLLAWKPAWFVHVRLEERYPSFRRTQEVFGSPGRYLGPFASGRSAERFIERIVDAFDLCRHPLRLGQAPDGPRCPYGQMGRCRCPCDGTIGAEEYRQVVAEAAAFAEGQRQELRGRLEEQMRREAAALRFERAAGLKARLARLEELCRPDYAYVRPAEDFRFLLVQRGPGRRKARAFLADRGTVRAAGELDHPSRLEQLEAVIAQMAPEGLAQDPDARAGRWRMGLVAHYLFASPRRAGLILPMRPVPTPQAVAAAIAASAAILGLSAAKGSPSPAAGEGSQPAGPAG